MPFFRTAVYRKGLRGEQQDCNQQWKEQQFAESRFLLIHGVLQNLLLVLGSYLSSRPNNTTRPLVTASEQVDKPII